MTLLTRALSLLLAAPLLPLILTATPAQAEVQPCTVTYTAAGTAIEPSTNPPDGGSLAASAIEVLDARTVTDVSFSIDLTHPEASGLRILLLSPGGLNPVWALDKDQATTSGRLDGRYTFDEELGTTTLVGNSPTAGTYRPSTSETIAEGRPATGRWQVWLVNFTASPGVIRDITVTLTYATCDSDGDGVEDSVDNCPTVVNDQANSDDDALGDACDADLDGDSIPNLGDGCPAVASTNPTGCPTAARKAGLRYVKSMNKLQVRIKSPVGACAANAKIVVWRARGNRDLRLVVGTANGQGVRRFKVARSARYYVTVSPSYASGIAECSKATSRTVRVPRRRR